MKPLPQRTSLSITDQNETKGLLSSWRWWIGPAVLAFALGYWYLDPFAGDWDALDYTVLALHGQPSSMVLGRILFIFSNRALYLFAHSVFGLAPAHAYLLFKYAVLFESPLAVIAWWVFARDLAGSKQSATLAALLIATSPFYVVYSGQAMTEIPSLLILAIALVLHMRGLKSRRTWMVLAGALLLGACVNVREGAALYAPWLVIAPYVFGWRFKAAELRITAIACLLFLIAALGPFLIWYWVDFNNYRSMWQGWVAATRTESARHPVSFSNFRVLLRFFFFTSPLSLVALPVAAFREIRARGFSPLIVFALLGLVINLSLIAHYSVVLNGRYLLTGLPLIVPLAGDYFFREQISKGRSELRAMVNIVLGILFITAVLMNDAWPVSSEYIRQRSVSKDYIQQLSSIPRDAVIIPGSQTVAVNYWRGIGTGNWDVIGTGSAWPGPKLVETITWYLANGRRVFIDVDPRWWSPCGWQADEIRELVTAGRSFRFKHVSGLFEIFAPENTQAIDNPNLEALLPENRPDDVKICSNY